MFEELHDEPEFQALKARVEADLAEQFMWVRNWEASGEPLFAPGTVTESH